MLSFKFMPLLSSTVFASIYAYIKTYIILKSPCLAYIMLLAFLSAFSEVFIGYWIKIDVLFPGDTYFSPSQHSLLACSSLSKPPELSPSMLGGFFPSIVSTGIVLVQLMFDQSY